MGNEREMGRGTLYLMIASAIFLVSSYVVHFGLGRHLGPEDYGLFGVVLALMTTINLAVPPNILLRIMPAWAAS